MQLIRGTAATTNFETVDPDRVGCRISGKDHALVSAFVSRALPGLNPNPICITTCMVTYGPDGQFIIGRPDGDHRLVVGGGDSGHAFKHAPGIGELLAQIVTGEPYNWCRACRDDHAPGTPDHSPIILIM